jgi:prolyl-tRNA editing enzyme YbaK/EbsC (Cys-tRNA(Pro) deacylase)
MQALDPGAISEQVFEKHSNLTHRQPVKTARADPARPARVPGVSDAADSILTHPSVARVRAALAEAGVQGAVVVLDGAARTAAQAAAYLGVDVAQIANSLVFTTRVAPDAPPEPLLVLTSGGHRVDTAKVAADLGFAQVGRADADFVRERTGFAIGGVAPVGHLAPLTTLVDSALAAYEVIWAAAGHPHAVFPTTFAELLRISGGTAADVA